MRFKVPQFLDIEDKIFGPFTFSEFAYLVGGGGLAFVFIRGLGWLLGFIPAILILGFSIALVFYKPNSKPLVYTLEAGLKYLMQDKLFIWKQRKVERKKSTNKEEIIYKETGPKLTGSKLKDLAWSLDILDSKNEEGKDLNLKY